MNYRNADSKMTGEDRIQDINFKRKSINLQLQSFSLIINRKMSANAARLPVTFLSKSDASNVQPAPRFARFEVLWVKRSASSEIFYQGLYASVLITRNATDDCVELVVSKSFFIYSFSSLNTEVYVCLSDSAVLFHTQIYLTVALDFASISPL